MINDKKPMNLVEFRDSINHSCSIHKNPEEVTVCITLSDRSIGPRANTGVRAVNLGFDWEANQFRVEPLDQIVRLGRSKEDEQQCLKSFDKIMNKTFFHCPRCEKIIRGKVRYCSSCGQRIAK